eukprot:505047_1
MARCSKKKTQLLTNIKSYDQQEQARDELKNEDAFPPLGATTTKKNKRAIKVVADQIKQGEAVFVGSFSKNIKFPPEAITDNPNIKAIIHSTRTGSVIVEYSLYCAVEDINKLNTIWSNIEKRQFKFNNIIYHVKSNMKVIFLEFRKQIE